MAQEKNKGMEDLRSNNLMDWLKFYEFHRSLFPLGIGRSRMEPATFLNLDLELVSSKDLAGFAEYFGKRVMILRCGKFGKNYVFSAEAVASRGYGFITDPVKCTEFFLHRLEALPASLVRLLRGCKTRVFDYGFDGGAEFKPLQTSLSPRHLARTGALRVEFRITVYPYTGNPPVDESGA